MLINDVTPVEAAAVRRTRARHHAAALTGMVAALALALAFALVPSALGQSATSPPAKPVPAPSVQGYGDHDKTCASWTDGCVNCQMGDNNAVTCSNTGIACQPQAISCVSRRTEPAKEPVKEPTKEPTK